MRLATSWTQGLIMILLYAVLALALVVIDSTSGDTLIVIVAMVLSWGLGAAYGRRQVYRKVGRAQE